MRKPYLSFLLALALSLAACGSGASDEEEIVEAIDYAFVSTDPDACTERMTPAFSEQLFRDDAADAVESCEQNAGAEESENDPVETTSVEVDGARATADVAFSDAQAFSVALMEDDGDWKLDEIVGFVDFNRGKWMDEQREFLEGGEPWPARVTDCVLDAYREMSQAEVEEMLLGGSPDPETEIISRCSSAG